MPIAIRHDPAARRFEAVVDGVRCVLEYELEGRTMRITHTGVPEAVGGRGIAAELVRTALAAARAQDWMVVPACSYAAAYMDRHPEYADLRA
jgi:predicted GNAT family acetyltransferase